MDMADRKDVEKQELQAQKKKELRLVL